MEKKKEFLESLEHDLEKVPKEVKATALLELIDRVMRKYNLSWIDLSEQLLNKTCPLCASRIRKCLNCKRAVSLGVPSCILCGEDTEKLQIELKLKKI